MEESVLEAANIDHAGAQPIDESPGRRVGLLAESEEVAVLFQGPIVTLKGANRRWLLLGPESRIRAIGGSGSAPMSSRTD